jgi:hypothetical protein
VPTRACPGEEIAGGTLEDAQTRRSGTQMGGVTIASASCPKGGHTLPRPPGLRRLVCQVSCRRGASTGAGHVPGGRAVCSLGFGADAGRQAGVVRDPRGGRRLLGAWVGAALGSRRCRRGSPPTGSAVIKVRPEDPKAYLQANRVRTARGRLPSLQRFRLAEVCPPGGFARPPRLMRQGSGYRGRQRVGTSA